MNPDKAQQMVDIAIATIQAKSIAIPEGLPASQHPQWLGISAAHVAIAAIEQIYGESINAD